MRKIKTVINKYVTGVVAFVLPLGTGYAKSYATVPESNNTQKQEDVMRASEGNKALATILGVITPATAFAASGAGEDSGIFVWIFLGFFAVIVVGQLIPAIMLMTGLVKGITAKTEVKSGAKE